MNEPYRPILPPKAGYVEVDGEYVPTEETRRVLNIEAQAADYMAFIAGLMEGYENG